MAARTDAGGSHGLHSMVTCTSPEALVLDRRNHRVQSREGQGDASVKLGLPWRSLIINSKEATTERCASPHAAGGSASPYALL